MPNQCYNGGYGYNGFLYSGSVPASTAGYPPATTIARSFGKESSIQPPTTTPVFGDAFWEDAWPVETDTSAPNLSIGSGSSVWSVYGMQRMTIPRHGNRPNSVPGTFPATSLMPGATDMVFVDGQAGTVPLEQLWQQTWYKNWVVPAKRPRLP